MPPKIYIVVEEIATAIWIEDGAVVGCALQVDGAPDWENNALEPITPRLELKLADAIDSLEAYVKRVQAGDIPRP